MFGAQDGLQHLGKQATDISGIEVESCPILRKCHHFLYMEQEFRVPQVMGSGGIINTG